ncbi:MAG: glycosyltransferase family 4 protein [Coriobacteriia bacterium]|nr:glycosyltransferase family 4 protein [Coriobacteriia bacterium]
MSRLRVAYTGNFESSITRIWIDEMRRRGVEPVALSVQRPSWEIEWAPIVLRRPRVRGLGFGRRDIANQIRNACRTHSIDVLHSHEARLNAFWASWSGFHPHVVSCWGSDVLRLEGMSAEYLRRLRRALSTADAVTCGSQHLVGSAVGAGARRELCVRVGWGVDTATYRPDMESRRLVREQWCAGERPVVLSTRQLKPLYRIDAIIWAFSLARRENRELFLVVAGDGPERGHLERLAAELGVAGHVLFTGHVPYQGWPTMADVLRGGDVYCSVPETDGGPLSVLEAMATALPVIASDIPVMREWIVGGRNGLLWGGGEEALAELMMLGLVSRQAIGGAAREFVQTHHERRKEMDRVREMYDRLIEGGVDDH